MLSPQGPQWSRHSIARVRRRDEYSTLRYASGKYEIWEDKESLFFICEKRTWELPSSILVTRNPNWSQRSDIGICCVKGKEGISTPHTPC
jgi:hypothetical protein